MQIKITISDETYDKIRQLAKSQYRSITQEINYLLDSAILTPDSPMYTPHDAPGGLHYPSSVRSPENSTLQRHTPTTVIG